MANTGDNERMDDLLPVGYWLGNFRIDGILGRGGFGVTYRAWADDLQEPVAIKEYYPTDIALRRPGEHTISARTARDTDTFEWGRQRFIDEARTLAALRQANPRNYSIVRVRMLFEEHDTAYMVQEFIEGYPMSEYLEDHGVVPEDVLKRWLEVILDGLAVVHGQGMIHRDLTPSNILIDDDDTPVLIDFGSARNLVESKTQLHDRVYKQSYAPIEQSSTDTSRQGPWTDIYSLAVVLYESVTGSLPPEAPDRIEEDDCAPAADKARGDYAPAFLAAVDHGLAVFSRDRPQTVEDWRDELFSETPVEWTPAAPRRAGPQSPPETEPAIPPADEPVPQREAGSRPRGGRIAVWAVFALVVVAGLGALGYTQYPGPVEAPTGDPGLYLTRDVRAGEMAVPDILRVVGGDQAVPGARPASLDEINGTCFMRSTIAGTLVEWAHLSVDCR